MVSEKCVNLWLICRSFFVLRDGDGRQNLVLPYREKINGPIREAKQLSGDVTMGRPRSSPRPSPLINRVVRKAGTSSKKIEKRAPGGPGDEIGLQANSSSSQTSADFMSYPAPGAYVQILASLEA